MRFSQSLVVLGGLAVGTSIFVFAQTVSSAGDTYAGQGVPLAPSGYVYAPVDPIFPTPGSPNVIGRNHGYSSGYSGQVVGNPLSTRNRPYHGAYGYGNYSNGSTDGYPPFRPANRFRRFR